MATTITNPKYTAVTITCTFGTLTNTSKQASTGVDNTGASQYDDFLIQIGAACATITGVVNVYLASSVDGTNYTDNVLAGDAAYNTAGTNISAVPGNLVLLGSLTLDRASTTRYSKVFSVASVCFGNPPEKFVIIIENQMGGTLTAGSIACAGVQYTTA